MELLNLLHIGLVLHIIGITMMVGIMIANFVAYYQVWIFLPKEKGKALLITKSISQFPKLMGAGGILILFSGILMLITFQGSLMHQVWFEIKMVLLLVLVLNALVIARPAGRKLRKLLKDDFTDQTEISTVKSRMTLFHLLQFFLFLIIFILSIFRFN